MLSVLQWDISVVTPLDFLEHFLARLDINDQELDKVRVHAQAFICLAAQGMNIYSIPEDKRYFISWRY